eukprot:SAG11_NODE_1187_length_5588_cov_6.285662_4_plen_151_part_00
MGAADHFKSLADAQKLHESWTPAAGSLVNAMGVTFVRADWSTRSPLPPPLTTGVGSGRGAGGRGAGGGGGARGRHDGAAVELRGLPGLRRHAERPLRQRSHQAVCTAATAWHRASACVTEWSGGARRYLGWAPEDRLTEFFTRPTPLSKL